MGHQISRGNADGVLLPCGVDFRHHGHIHPPQLPDEIIEQGMGSGVGVGLEGAENPLVAHGLDGGQQSVEFAGVVGVVVVDVGPVVHTLFLHAAACTVERGQATGRRFTVDAAVPRHGNGR